MELTPFLKRVALAKLMGLGLGALGIWILGATVPGDRLFLWGLLGWTITLGALIGILGFYRSMPFLGIAIPAWLRGSWCGAWLGLLLVLIGYGPLSEFIADVAWLPAVFANPWWVVVEMAFWGAVIDMIVTGAIGSTPWPESGVDEDAP